jgi:UDP-perosamine 4-acetyltransferase
MKKIILIGAGGHCKSTIDVIEKEKKYKIVGLVDNKKKGYFCTGK